MENAQYYVWMCLLISFALIMVLTAVNVMALLDAKSVVRRVQAENEKLRKDAAFGRRVRYSSWTKRLTGETFDQLRACKECDVHVLIDDDDNLLVVFDDISADG